MPTRTAQLQRNNLKLQSLRTKKNLQNFKLELKILNGRMKIAQKQREILKAEGLEFWEIQARYNATKYGVIRTKPELKKLDKLETITEKINAIKRILKGWKI